MKQSLLTGVISTAILLGMAVFSGAGFKDDSCPETPATQEPVTLFLVSAMAGAIAGVSSLVSNSIVRSPGESQQ